jgi:hypothetical protein
MWLLVLARLASISGSKGADFLLYAVRQIYPPCHFCHEQFGPVEDLP